MIQINSCNKWLTLAPDELELEEDPKLPELELDELHLEEEVEDLLELVVTTFRRGSCYRGATFSYSVVYFVFFILTKGCDSTGSTSSYPTFLTDFYFEIMAFPKIGSTIFSFVLFSLLRVTDFTIGLSNIGSTGTYL